MEQIKLMTNQDILDLIIERDRYLDALREIQAVPYYDLADNPAALKILDIVSAVLKTAQQKPVGEAG